MGVFAHPDDESLLAGGVLARHRGDGARTAVVTATWAPDSPRAAELAAALAVLGAGAPRMLGYRDARDEASAPGQPRLCDVDLDEAVAQLVRHIRQFRPTSVIGHDALGQLTGHPATAVPTRSLSSLSKPRAFRTSTRKPVNPGSPGPCTRPLTPPAASVNWDLFWRGSESACSVSRRRT